MAIHELEGAATADAFGAAYMKPSFNAVYAEVCLLGGRLAEALAAIYQGLRVVQESGERWYEAELHRLRGVVLAALGHRSDDVVDEFHRAIAIAAAQGALGFKRRAEASLAETATRHRL